MSLRCYRSERRINTQHIVKTSKHCLSFVTVHVYINIGHRFVGLEMVDWSIYCTSHITTSNQRLKPCLDCKEGKIVTHFSQIARYPTEHSLNHCILTSRKGHMGRRTARERERERITTCCACEVTQESQSVLLLLGQASVG